MLMRPVILYNCFSRETIEVFGVFTDGPVEALGNILQVLILCEK